MTVAELQDKSVRARCFHERCEHESKQIIRSDVATCRELLQGTGCPRGNVADHFFAETISFNVEGEKGLEAHPRSFAVANPSISESECE